MAFGTLAGGPHQVGSGLCDFDPGAMAVDQESPDQQGRGDQNRDEDRTK
jgi:hypothetical protein